MKAESLKENYRNEYPEYCFLTTLDLLMSAIVSPFPEPGTQSLAACLASWEVLA